MFLVFLWGHNLNSVDTTFAWCFKVFQRLEIVTIRKWCKIYCRGQ